MRRPLSVWRLSVLVAMAAVVLSWRQGDEKRQLAMALKPGAVILLMHQSQLVARDGIIIDLPGSVNGVCNFMASVSVEIAVIYWRGEII